MQRLDTSRRYRETEEVDYVIVGLGAGGGVLSERLARGISGGGFDAGPLWDTERDWVSDEAGSRKLYWEDLRITGGSDPLSLGAKQQWQRRSAAKLGLS
jgi:choline dehydrogenase-like flavoprotein